MTEESIGINWSRPMGTGALLSATKAILTVMKEYATSGGYHLTFNANNANGLYSGETVQPSALQSLVCIKT